MASFSTYDALMALCQSIPEWTNRLDQQITQISLRQIELARLGIAESPPARSVKNKGSTESLRRHTGENDPILSYDAENVAEVSGPSPQMPTSNPTSPRPNFAAADAGSSAVAIPSSKVAAALTRQASQPTQARPSRAVIKKNKTASLASGESIAPKYRTRSMIMVWYDGEVQRAFENMVTLVSASRAAMRKGKMAAKMRDMKRAAELELDEDDEDDDGANLVELTLSKGRALTPQINASSDKPTPVTLSACTNGMDPIAPLLPYISTRQMGPKAESKFSNVGSTMSTTMLKGYKRSGGDGPDVFDIIDKGLEWVQAQCEHAASHVLRNPDCNTEIAGIKNRIAEVRSTAEAEMERLAANGGAKTSLFSEPETKGRQSKSPMKRRDFKAPNQLDADIEVDDEAVDDLGPPQLNFKRSRDASQR